MRSCLERSWFFARLWSSTHSISSRSDSSHWHYALSRIATSQSPTVPTRCSSCAPILLRPLLQLSSLSNSSFNSPNLSNFISSSTFSSSVNSPPTCGPSTSLMRSAS